MIEIPKIKAGQRVIAVGRTGSGKSVFSQWLVKHTSIKWIVLDLKNDDGFTPMGPVVSYFPSVESTWKKPGLLKLFEDSQFIIIRPNPLQANNPDLLDRWILYLHENMENVGLLADELYYLHRNGQALPGLLGWLTRGRSRKQSFLGESQRPAWVSQFVFSEADYFSVFTLNLLADRKRVYEFTGEQSVLVNPPPYYFRWYQVKSDKIQLFAPVPV